MQESQQIELFEPGDVMEVEYVPPRDEVIDTYARAVHEALPEQFRDRLTLTEKEFTREFADFVRIITRIRVKHLNRGVKRHD
jgi:hypothetical protein